MEFEEKIKRIHALERKKGLLEDEISALRSEVASEVKPGERFEVDNLIVTVMANRRFDPKKATTLLTEEELLAVSEMKTSPAKVKALHPDMYDMMQNDFAPKVSIREAQ